MVQSTEEFRVLVKSARRAGTPLLAVRTADPASAMAHVSECLCGKAETPVFAWEIMGGLAPRNRVAREMAAQVFGESAAVAGPADALLVLHKSTGAKAFADAVVFFQNPQRLWEQVDIVQGIWNLRDVFKVGGQMLVLITPPGSILPVELQNDVMVIDEPLPSSRRPSADHPRPVRLRRTAAAGAVRGGSRRGRADRPRGVPRRTGARDVAF